MSYEFRIFNKGTNTEATEHKQKGICTNWTKQKAICKAVETLQEIGKEKYFAILYKFDWKTSYKIVGKIEV